MRILYITDDRSTYTQGNYYQDYLNAFDKNHEVVVSDLQDKPDLSLIDLIIIGHGGQELLIKKAPLFSLYRIKKLRIEKNSKVIASSNIPKILLSKNDYKAFQRKKDMQVKMNAGLLVTHSKSAVPLLSNEEKYKTAWFPFAVDTDKFINQKQERKFSVGFKAKSNTAWNEGIREKFFHELSDSLGTEYSTDLTMTEDGSNFLLGEKYVSWLNQCRLLGNTVSAVGTVGPRFLESIACGCVPLAPKHEYEGLLIPEENYISIESKSEIKEKVDRFLEDEEYQRKLKDGGKELVRQHNVAQQVKDILKLAEKL